MNQYSPFDEIKIDRNVCLKKIINTSDDNEIGYFLEVDLGYPYKIEQEQNISHFVLKINLYAKMILMSI